MTIPEAVELVIQSGAMGQGGDVFVLKMGEPVRIKDLAEKMIHLSGLELKDDDHPNGDIEIKYTGLRPGEKLYEELLIDPAQSQPTKHPRIFSSAEPLPETVVLEKEISILTEAIEQRDLSAALDSMKRIVPEYNPDNGQ